MRKLFWTSIVLMVSMVACEKLSPEGEDKKDSEEIVDPDKDNNQDGEEGGNNGGNDGGNSGGDEYDSTGQKAKLESIAKTFMAEFPAANYEEAMSTMSDLYNHCSTYYASETYNWSALETVLEERYNAIFSETDLGNNITSYTFLLFLSQCKGHVTLGATAATYAADNNTVLTITDSKGVIWTATIIAEGAVKTVNLGDFEDSWSNGYWDENGNYYEEEFTDRYHIEVEVPEKLIVSLKKGDSQYAKVTLDFDVDLGSNGADLENDKVSVVATAEFQGIKVNVHEFGYNAKTGSAKYYVVLENNGKMILTEKASGTGNLDYEEETWEAKNINAEIDLMGLLQIKGKCADAKSITSILDNADPQSASDWERIVNNVNKCYEINMYYDGSDTVQAKINLEPRMDEDSYGKYYYTEPAIEFPDGSRYLFYEYFTEDNFGSVVTDAEGFYESYCNLLEKYFDFLF